MLVSGVQQNDSDILISLGDQVINTDIRLALFVDTFYNFIRHHNKQQTKTIKSHLNIENKVNFPNLHISGLTRKERGFLSVVCFVLFCFDNGLLLHPYFRNKELPKIVFN